MTSIFVLFILSGGVLTPEAASTDSEMCWAAVADLATRGVTAECREAVFLTPVKGGDA